MTITQAIKDEIYDILQVIHLIWDYDITVINGSAIKVNNIVIAFLFIIIVINSWPAIQNRVFRFVVHVIPGDKAMQQLIANLVRYTSLWFVFLIVLDIANVPFKALAVLTGLFGIGVGFGTKEIIYNFFSGVIIVVTKPIKIGDFIDICEYRGTVHEINIRCIVLRTLRKVDILIPNSKVLESNIVNWTSIGDDIRMNVRLHVTDLTLVEKAERDLKALLDNMYFISNSNPLEIYLSLVEHDYFVLEIDYFIDINQNGDLSSIKDDVNRAILDYAMKNKVKMKIRKHEIKTC